MTGFVVSAEQLAEKAEAVGEVADSIRECATAGGEIGVGGLVYGVLFDATLLPVLSLVKHSLLGVITNVAEVGDKISDGLKKNADTYRSVEEFIESHLSGMTADMDGSW